MLAPCPKRIAGTIVAIATFVSTVSLGHGKRLHEMHHRPAAIEQPLPASAEQDHDILAGINQSYLQSVKAIFVNSCANCHSNKTTYPWYHSIPGVKQLIDQDIREARDHLDVSNDFPFAGHGSPATDLEAIQSSIASGKMPPWSYRLMHSESILSNEARASVEKWVQESLSLLQESPRRNSSNE